MEQNQIQMAIDYGIFCLKNLMKMEEEVVGQFHDLSLKEYFAGLILKTHYFQDIIGGKVIGMKFSLERWWADKSEILLGMKKEEKWQNSRK